MSRTELLKELQSVTPPEALNAMVESVVDHLVEQGYVDADNKESVRESLRNYLPKKEDDDEEDH